MKKFITAIINIVEAGGSAFLRYPASMICAFGVAVTSSVMLQLNISEDTKIFTCLMISFILGALLNAAVVVSKERINAHGVLSLSLDILGIFLPIAVFLLLLLPFNKIPELFLSRAEVLIIISAVMFVLVPSFNNEKINFNKMIFLILKSFLISFIYCLVLTLGLFFIAFSVKSLLYSGLDNRVYGHISIFMSFLAFALFLGYLPSFRKDDREDENLEMKLKVPAFIEVLLSYIVVPLVTVTFFVLAIWGGKILWWHNWPPFEQFNFIFSGYLLFGSFVFILLSPMHDSMSRFYRRFFPITSLPLLALQAFNIYGRIKEFALTDSRYFLVIIWIFSLVCIITFLIKPVVKNHIVFIAIAVLAIISVLPFFNYKDLSVYTQVLRAEILLKQNDMLEAGSIKPNSMITSDDKLQISEAVKYITTRGKASMAPWLNEKFDYATDFKNVFGFEPQYEYGVSEKNMNEKISYIGNLSGDYYSIDGYNIIITPQDGYLLSSDFSTDKIPGKKGTYVFEVRAKEKNGVKVPVILLKKNDKVIIENDLYDYLYGIKSFIVKNQDKTSAPVDVPVDKMTYKIETPDAKLMLVFKTVNVVMSSDGNAKEEYILLISGIFIAG